MLIPGTWSVCDDGVTRPVLRGRVETADGKWEVVPFLVDTGADCTLFSAAVLATLGLSAAAGPHALGGIGGSTEFVSIETRIQFTQEDGSPVFFRGRYTALSTLHTLDMRVLGRDILNLFALIVDRPNGVVCLLGQRHRYTIEVMGSS
jgi:hypothetical protein